MIVAMITVVTTSALAQFSTTPSPASPSRADTMMTVGEDFKNNSYYAIGLNVGLLSGAGLAGRASWPGGFAAQFAFWAMSVPGSKYSTHFNIGAEAQYAFASNRSGRLYSLLGFGYYDTGYQDTAFSGNAVANPFRFGFGIGYEAFTTPNLALAASLAITFFPVTEEFIPIPQLGLFYYFK